VEARTGLRDCLRKGDDLQIPKPVASIRGLRPEGKELAIPSGNTLGSYNRLISLVETDQQKLSGIHHFPVAFNDASHGKGLFSRPLQHGLSFLELL
jgi:hypothetical protein